MPSHLAGGDGRHGDLEVRSFPVEAFGRDDARKVSPEVWRRKKDIFRGPLEGRPGGGWREPADARGRFEQLLRSAHANGANGGTVVGELALAARFSPQARMPPTARSAPRGARPGLLVLTAGPAYCSRGVTPPDPGGVLPARSSAAAGLTPGDAKQQRRRGRIRPSGLPQAPATPAGKPRRDVGAKQTGLPGRQTVAPPTPRDCRLSGVSGLR
jgi:hypothetical protein